MSNEQITQLARQNGSKTIMNDERQQKNQKCGKDVETPTGDVVIIGEEKQGAHLENGES